jgi:lipopolysaccharide/colanic/teichoic acid biosynthesis glycosyltransferase
MSRSYTLRTASESSTGNVLSGFLKRAMDVGLAILGLGITGAIMAAVTVRIAADRDGPIFYRGVRVGHRGRTFKMYKFRTMVVTADLVGGPNTPDGDPRITRTGRFLRRWKLDELPQLINVVKGDMSLVGPRPQVPEEVAQYTREERDLLRVRPGITDWASLRFHDEGDILRGHPDPDVAYATLIRPEKMRLGLQYVRGATILDDLGILWATFLLPIRRCSRTVPLPAGRGGDGRTATSDRRSRPVAPPPVKRP